MKEFKMPIATNEAQSKQLLQLGISENTADMYYWIDSKDVEYYHELNIIVNDDIEWGEEFIPAWSLSRLIDLLPFNIHGYFLNVNLESIDYSKINDCDDNEYLYSKSHDNIFDGIINTFNWLIKNNYFNKEYLK